MMLNKSTTKAFYMLGNSMYEKDITKTFKRVLNTIANG